MSDVDDNAPVFHKNEYTASLLENATAGTFVVQINASDIDADEAHKTIHYRIEGGNEQRKFLIGGLNGTVYLNWTGEGLDREKVPSYTLIVAAISRVNNTEQKSTVRVSIDSVFACLLALPLSLSLSFRYLYLYRYRYRDRYCYRFVIVIVSLSLSFRYCSRFAIVIVSLSLSFRYRFVIVSLSLSFRYRYRFVIIIVIIN